jgi:hypothetical protein
MKPVAIQKYWNGECFKKLLVLQANKVQFKNSISKADRTASFSLGSMDGW